MAKRKNGEGSWGKKRVNGYEYRYFKKLYPGMTKEKTFYGKTEKEVRAKVKEFEKDLKANTVEIPKMTFGMYIENYLKTLRPTLTPNGYDGYEDIIIARIKNFKEYDLYNKQMNQLSTEVFQNYINALGKKYAIKTIRKTGGFISQCLEYAADEDRNDIPRNYMKKVIYPSEITLEKKTRKHLFLSKQQMEKFCAQALHIETDSERYNHRVPLGDYTYANNGPALALIGHTGMRVGELIALTWEHVNFESRLIEIEDSESLVKVRDKQGNAVKHLNSRGEEVFQRVRKRKDTKTEAGKRYVPMTDLAYEVLRYFERYKKGDDSIVCVNTVGNPMHKDTLLRTTKTLCQRANVPIVTTHELRHSYGSILLHEEHVDIQVISTLLGHKDITTTYNIYAHVLKEIMAKSVTIFNK